jgi:hypothetical protein
VKTFVIGDCQHTATTSLDIVKASAQYIVEERPEEVVIIGDWFDLESLSMYSNNLEKEGRRLYKDLDKGIEALDVLLKPLRDLQRKQSHFKKKVYRPKIVFTMGNHEKRLDRYIESNPLLSGSLPDLTKILEENGIIVYDFLVPYIGLSGVHYFHYLANPMSGRAIGGSMDNKLNKVTYSFVMGHQQHFQFAERQQASGNPQFGVVVGAFYEHDEGYKGAQGNTHSRGTVILHHTASGKVDVEFISCERFKAKYLD